MSVATGGTSRRALCGRYWRQWALGYRARPALLPPGTSTPCHPGRGDAPLFTAAQTGPWPFLPGGTLTLENGGTIELPADGPRPDELPLGYHCFEPAEPPTAGSPHDWPRIVAVCPARCPEPPPGRTWGWSAQLYATRSRDSWGIGDFGDLRSLVDWAGDNGAGFVLLNPLNAPALGPVPEPSPYFPSSRCFLNPLYIRVEEVPGAGDLAGIATLALKAKALNDERLIDRTSVWALKSEALEALFARFEQTGGDPGFEQYARERGKVLDGYTSFSRWPSAMACPGKTGRPNIVTPIAPQWPYRLRAKMAFFFSFFFFLFFFIFLFIK